MPSFEDEIANNFSNFKAKWQTELSTVQSALATSEAIYLKSYQRLTSLNAWRELLLENELPSEAHNFFCESQNDAVSSHVFAYLGSWRAALQFLRSCIENVFFCEYYKDHPIELRLWAHGRHQLGFNEMMNYFYKHPDIEGISNNLTGLQLIQREYSVLSRAVHSSATSFRMTVPNGKTNLWTSEVRRLQAWSTREYQTITGINLFLMSIHRDKLQGAKLPGLRKAIGPTIGSTALRKAIRNGIAVNLQVTI